MKTSSFPQVLVVLTLFAPLFAQQTDEPTWTGMSGYQDGVQIYTGQGTIPPGGAGWAGVGRMSQSSAVPNGHGLYEIVEFPEGKTIVYEFTAQPVPDQEDAFQIALRPVAPTPKQAVDWGIDPASVDTDFLKKYPAPFVVKGGEWIAIEVAQNPKTGEKLVHYFLVSRGTPYLHTNLERLSSQAREFRAEDAEIEVENYDIRRNGVSLHAGGGGCRGKYIWIEIPGAGRFIFTLTPPPPTAGFQPSALVKDRQISFRHGADSYDWLSKRQIAPGGGIYQLWMRVEPIERDMGITHGAAGGVGAADDIPPHGFGIE